MSLCRSLRNNSCARCIPSDCSKTEGLRARCGGGWPACESGTARGQHPTAGCSRWRRSQRSGGAGSASAAAPGPAARTLLVDRSIVRTIVSSKRANRSGSVSASAHNEQSRAGRCREVLMFGQGHQAITQCHLTRGPMLWGASPRLSARPTLSQSPAPTHPESSAHPPRGPARR